MESSNNTDEVRLCKQCQSFYGRMNTNFLCSSCFKQSAKESLPSAQVSQAATPVKQQPEQTLEASLVPSQQNSEIAQAAATACLIPSQVSESPVQPAAQAEEVKDEPAPKVQVSIFRCNCDGFCFADD